ncbi:hypothetical protein ACO2Q8_07855 [Larkinella sp. VNQ87]|uniref:hypothetical protein n=1 Tax=Larkinella sp. VNQ87 TaxID=3400921 RepID=UPI003C0956E4
MTTTQLVQTGEDIEVNLTCLRGRDFDLEIGFPEKDLSLSTFRLQVRDDADALLLEFASADGSIELFKDTDMDRLKLFRIGAQITLPTGFHRYELVENQLGRLDTTLKGFFIVKPTVTV